MAHPHHDDHDHAHGHDHGYHDHGNHAPAAAATGHAHAGHGHGHHHGHHHGDPQHHGRAFVIAIALNTVFVAVEFIYGFLANSTALMADAGHNLSDVLGLVLAYGAMLLARKPPNQRYTYGLRGSSILAALGNATLLFVACGAIGWEAVQRLAHPPAVVSTTVMWVAGLGIVINGLSAWLFMKGSKGDLNIRGAYLHMVADAAVSLGVVLSGVLMLYTGWFLVDPLTSLVIVAVILWGSWALLRESVQLALNAVPPHIDPAAVAQHLRSMPGVSDIHDLHVWALSTTESALTVNLLMPAGHPGDAALIHISQQLRDTFGVQHSTLQVMLNAGGEACSLQQPLGPPSAAR
ncbi:MAG: cation transporter [Rhizobacter sp.]